MSTIFLYEGDAVRPLDSLDARPQKTGGDALLWVDLDDPSAEATDDVAEAFGLDEDCLQRLSSTAGGAYFRDAGDFVHVTLYTPAKDPADGMIEIECVVGEGWIVTAHDGSVTVLEEFAERASGSGKVGKLDGPGFLAALFEWVINEYARAFEGVEELLERFDTRAMRGERTAEEEIEHLVELRTRVGQLRRSLTAHRGPLLALAHPELVALGDDASADRFEQLLDRLESAVQTARDARESVVSSFDVLIARTAHRTNEIVKVLTLASVIFLPGALIAGVLGMNFQVGLFTHPVLFWIAISIMAAIGITTITLAKLRDWI